MSILDTTYITLVLDTISRSGSEIELGLREDEFARIESSFGFRFPPDLRNLLRSGLPTGQQFPGWRHDSVEQLCRILDGPVDGIAFDVAENHYWRPEWGDRPRDVEEAITVARMEIGRAPRLIPVFGHRFIPSEPLEAGNPVFSVSQADVVVYGNDLMDYFAHEFHITRPEWTRSAPKHIRFWSELAA